MHSIIFDDGLAAGLRSVTGEAEIWDTDDRFLGAFVPAPGGVPGPEWDDSDDRRERIVATATAREKLRAAPGEVKLRDPAGHLLGWFVPVAPAEADRLAVEMAAGTMASTADVLTRLKALGLGGLQDNVAAGGA